MPTVRLYDSVGFGLILDFPTGVLYSNQTGGTACYQPELEGFYIPVANDFYEEQTEFSSPEIELTAFFLSGKHGGGGATNGLDSEDVSVIDKILSQYNLYFISVDQSKLAESHEAWVWVNVKIDRDNSLFHGFSQSEFKGVITWPNSD